MTYSTLSLIWAIWQLLLSLLLAMSLCVSLGLIRQRLLHPVSCVGHLQLSLKSGSSGKLLYFPASEGWQ